MTYTLHLKESKKWFVNLELLKDWKVKTFCDTNISKDFLLSFWEDYLNRAYENTINIIENNFAFTICIPKFSEGNTQYFEEYKDNERSKDIKPNKLFNIFALSFLYTNNDIWVYDVVSRSEALCLKFTDFLGNIFTSNDLTSKDDKKSFIERIAWSFFNIIQFENIEWFFNANSKLLSLKDEYEECHENIYLDGLYFQYIDKIDKYETLEIKDLRNIKWFQDLKKMNNFYWKVFNSNFINFIKRKNIDLIYVIPNNQERKTNFNDFILDKLQLDLKEYTFWNIHINKSIEREAQKSIRWLCNRIKNAQKLLSVEEKIDGRKNILLIDDVFWSGATMNTVAKKLKENNQDVHILWFSMLWHYSKWFDIINEV